MMLHRVYVPLFFLILLHFFSPHLLHGANGKELQEILSSGTINWSKGIITATGSGAPPSSAENIAQGRIMARRAAILDARRNLLETVRGVRVNAMTTVQNHMTASDKVVTRVSGIVKMSRVVDTRYLSNGIVEVTVAMGLRGDLLSLMLEETQEIKGDYTSGGVPTRETPYTSQLPSVEKPKTKPSAPLPTPPKPSQEIEVKKAKQEEKKEVKINKKEKTREEVLEDIDLSELNYSGLVVDARRLRLRPALIPKIMDQRGEEVYSTANLLRKDAVKMGVVGYAKEVDAAKKNQRVTDTPFVIKAIRATGQKRTDVVIKNRDSMVVRGSDRYTNYLKNGRVLIVYD